MAGHSKWANIRHRKGAQDAKRGKIFTKIIKEITVAARLGGGDKIANPRLRKAVSIARSNNMPQDNILRAIKKGTGELAGVDYQEMVYEGYGPCGIAIYMNVITDNKNRTVSEIRHILSKNAGSLAEPGSVSWMFKRTGLIVIPSHKVDDEKLLKDVLEVGANDFDKLEDDVLIFTDHEKLLSIKDGLEKLKYYIKSFDIVMTPNSFQFIEEKDQLKVLKLIEDLDNHDDINQVFSNFSFKKDN